MLDYLFLIGDNIFILLAWVPILNAVLCEVSILIRPMIGKNAHSTEWVKVGLLVKACVLGQSQII